MRKYLNFFDGSYTQKEMTQDEFMAQVESLISRIKAMRGDPLISTINDHMLDRVQHFFETWSFDATIRDEVLVPLYLSHLEANTIEAETRNAQNLANYIAAIFVLDHLVSTIENTCHEIMEEDPDNDFSFFYNRVLNWIYIKNLPRLTSLYQTVAEEVKEERSNPRMQPTTEYEEIKNRVCDHLSESIEAALQDEKNNEERTLLTEIINRLFHQFQKPQIRL